MTQLGTKPEEVHFFISRAGADSDWAQWIAWQLVTNGYRVILQDWNFGPGINFPHKMHQAATLAKRTIAVLSPHYFTSPFTEVEWTEPFSRDPVGERGLLLPIRVTNFTPMGIFGPINSLDLFDLDKNTARDRLLKWIDRVDKQDSKPSQEPDFPNPAKQGSFMPSSPEPNFPGGAPTRSSNVPSLVSRPLAPFLIDLPQFRPAEFFQSEKTRKDIVNRLQSHRCRRLAIWGRPGIGKSQLALTVAEDAKEYFPGGVLVADLKVSVDKPTSVVSESLALWARATKVVNNVQESAEKGLLGPKLTELWERDQRPRLFILIGSSHKSELAQLLLDRCPESTFIITTHDCSHATFFAGADGVIPLEGFAEDEDAIELLQEHAKVCFIADDKDKALKLISRLGRDPVALTLLGDWIRDGNYAGNVANLEKICSDLQTPLLKKQIAEKVIVIEGLLEQEANDALRALAALPWSPSTFSSEAARFILKSDDRGIDQLANFGLLKREGSRYCLSRSLNHYFYHQVHEDLLAPKLRMIEYFARFLHENANDFPAIKPERDNIERSILMARDLNRHADAVSLAIDFSDFLQFDPHYDASKFLLLAARASAKECGDLKSEIEILNRLGGIAKKFGHYIEGHDWYQEGLSLSKTFEDIHADLLLGLANLEDRYGDNARAQQRLQDSPNTLFADPQRQWRFRETMGWIYAHGGNYSSAKQEWLRGLEMLEGQSFPELPKARCWLRANLGWIEDRQGNPQVAAQYLEDALYDANQLTDFYPWCTVMINLGALDIHMGAFAKAEKELLQALEVAKRDAIDSVNIFLENLSIISLRKGDDEIAEQRLCEGLSAAAEVGDPERIAAFLSYLGELANCVNDLKASRHYLITSLALARRTGNRERIATSLLNLGLTEIRLLDLSSAESHLREALAEANRIGYKWQQAAIHNALGVLFTETKQPVRAKHEFETASQIAESIHSEDNQVLAYRGLSKVASDPKATKWWLDRSEKKRSAIGLRKIGLQEWKAASSTGGSSVDG